MSNLIIMPDANGSFPPAKGNPEVRTNYAGRMLALDIDKGKVFQTHKFYLGPNRPVASVPADADMSSISTAVLNGRLIDVTDQHGSGFKHEMGEMSAVRETEDPSLRKVFIGVKRTDEVTLAGQGRQLFIAIPENEEQEAAMLHDLQTKGRIDGEFKPQINPDVEFGGISVSDLPPSKYRASTKKETSWSLFKKAIKLLGWEIVDKLKRR